MVLRMSLYQTLWKNPRCFRGDLKMTLVLVFVKTVKVSRNDALVKTLYRGPCVASTSSARCRVVHLIGAWKATLPTSSSLTDHPRRVTCTFSFVLTPCCLPAYLCTTFQTRILLRRFPDRKHLRVRKEPSTMYSHDSTCSGLL